MYSIQVKWSFKSWVLDKYFGKNNPKGDLAGDISEDMNFPDSCDFTVVASYLSGQRPCLECWEVFMQAWQEYTRWLVKEWA